VNVIKQINANQVITGSTDATIKIWNSSTNTLVNTYYGHTNEISGIVVLPDGILASGSWDCTVRIWDTVNNAVTVIATGWIDRMVWNPVTGQLIANGGGQLNVINPASLTLTNFSTYGLGYFAVDVLLPSGLVILGGSHLDIWDSTSGMRLFTYTVSGTIQTVKLLPDNVTAVCGYQSTGLLQLFDTNLTTFGSQNYTGHANSVVMITNTPDLLYVITAASDNAVIIWTWSSMSLMFQKKFTVSTTVNIASLIASVYTDGTRIYCFIIITVRVFLL
jgi:WD40 repeat protein